MATKTAKPIQKGKKLTNVKPLSKKLMATRNLTKISPLTRVV